MGGGLPNKRERKNMFFGSLRCSFKILVHNSCTFPKYLACELHFEHFKNATGIGTHSAQKLYVFYLDISKSLIDTSRERWYNNFDNVFVKNDGCVSNFYAFLLNGIKNCYVFKPK